MSLLIDNIGFLLDRPGEQQGSLDKLGLAVTVDEMVKGAKAPTIQDLLLLSNHFGLSADLMLSKCQRLQNKRLNCLYWMWME